MSVERVGPPSFETLRVEIDGRIGRLTLDQPRNLNPLGSTALRELAQAAMWFDTTDASIVVVTGEGRAFSSGFDLREFAAGGREATGAVTGNTTDRESKDRESADHESTDRETANRGSVDRESTNRASADLGRRMADAIERMTALTIAAIKGPCIGGGVVLASACDIRIAADDTVFSIPEVDLGIPLAWGGIPRLVREIGPALTRELVLTCRPFDAQEARSIGFVNRVVARAELDSSVDALANELALKAPSVVRATKRQVNEALDAISSTAGSWADADLLGAAMRDPQARAAAGAYLARRTPR